MLEAEATNWHNGECVELKTSFATNLFALSSLVPNRIIANKSKWCQGGTNKYVLIVLHI